jgi:hypothetical protein
MLLRRGGHADTVQSISESVRRLKPLRRVFGNCHENDFIQRFGQPRLEFDWRFWRLSHMSRH